MTALRRAAAQMQPLFFGCTLYSTSYEYMIPLESRESVISVGFRRQNQNLVGHLRASLVLTPFALY